MKFEILLLTACMSLGLFAAYEINRADHFQDQLVYESASHGALGRCEMERLKLQNENIQLTEALTQVTGKLKEATALLRKQREDRELRDMIDQIPWQNMIPSATNIPHTNSIIPNIHILTNGIGLQWEFKIGMPSNNIPPTTNGSGLRLAPPTESFEHYLHIQPLTPKDQYRL